MNRNRSNSVLPTDMADRTAPVDPDPFRFDGDRRGMLLVHGFTGTPFEMRLLGESLARRGFTVVGPRLAGHGGSAAALAATDWRDWLATVERAFDELRARCDRVGVCGLSLGGLLTLELARRRRDQIAAIASLSAPLWLSPWIMKGVPLTLRSSLLRGVIVPKLGGSDIADPEMRRKNPTGHGVPLRSVGALLEFMAEVDRGVGEVERPALVAHGRRDRTVPFGCMESIASRLCGPVERFVLDRSAHVVTLDVERERLFARLDAFFTRHLGAAEIGRAAD